MSYETGDGQVLVRMPLTYTAFRAGVEELYMQYATVRIGRERARRLVEAALGDLAMSWPQALRSASPAAVSWDLLTGRAAQMRGSAPGAPYDVLARPCADAFVLRYRMGLSCRGAADLMGITQSALRSHLRAGHRALG